MWKKKNILFLFIYTLLLSALIFVGRSIFFPSTYLEEQYIEPTIHHNTHSHSYSHPHTHSATWDIDFQSFSWVTQDDVRDAVAELIYEEFSQKYSQEQKDKVQIRYVPSSLFWRVEYSYAPILETYMYSRSTLSDINDLGVFLYQNRTDTRGRMKSQNIHIYGIESLDLDEFLSILIHEFAHYVDIYTLPRNTFWDESQRFYDISWDSATRIKPSMLWEDFVSGYAMTNQYEDFAESYLYYVLHNKAFLEKTNTSSVLAKKYSYFQNYIFPQNMFYKEDFSLEKETKDYYWDITKLQVDVKKFLQYMQSDI